MFVTLFGIVTEVKPLQSQKAPFLMFLTLFGIVTEVKLRQLEKVYSPMLVTPFGIVTDVKLTQLQKAQSPILVTLFGIVTEVKLPQYWKAAPPMLLTLFGSVIEVKQLLIQKASPPILVTSDSNLIIPLPPIYVFDTIVGSEPDYGVIILPFELVYQISLFFCSLGTLTIIFFLNKLYFPFFDISKSSVLSHISIAALSSL